MGGAVHANPTKRVLPHSLIIIIIIIIIGRAKGAPHWGVQSRFRVICDSMSVVCQINCVGGIT